MEGFRLNFEGLWYESGQGEDNHTLTCAARGLGADTNATSHPSSLVISLRVFHAMYFLVFVTVGSAMNLLVVFLVVQSRIMRNLTFAIAVQIALANLGIIAVFGIPCVIQNTYGPLNFNLDLCTASGYIYHTLADVRVFLTFVFTLDRFASIFAPFWYPRQQLIVTVMTSAVAWALAIVFNLIGIPQILDCYAYSRALLACTMTVFCSKNCMIFQVTYILAIVSPALFVSLVLITAMYIKGKKIRQQTSQMVDVGNYRTRSGWKALKTFLLLVLTVVVVKSGIGMLFIYFFFEGASVHTPVFQLIVTFMNLHVFIDPIAILRNGDARKALKNLTKYFTKK